MSQQLAATTLRIEPRQRTRSWRWDVVQALHDQDGALTDVDLAAATGADIESIRRAIEGLATGGVVRLDHVSGHPHVAMICRLAAI